jgi:dihydrofolate reductase
MKPRVTMVAALATNRAIGRDNRMPWHLPEDLKHFKRVTQGHPVLMGRKTFESILASLGKPLPGRTNIIISRNLNYRPEGLSEEAARALVLVDSPQNAMKSLDGRASSGSAPTELFVIGGAEIYRAMLPVADRLILTEIHASFEGDAFFPVIDPQQWQEVARTGNPKSGTPEVSFDFVEYKRAEQQGVE